MNGDTIHGFSGRRAARIAGISYRQLDYWARTDLIRPSLTDANGSGSRREYSYDDLHDLRLIRQLLDTGYELQRIRHIMDTLETQTLHDDDLVVLSMDGVTVVSTDDLLGEALRRPCSMVVSVGQITEDLDQRIAVLA